MIKHTSFKHGWFYHYRVHKQKAKNLCSAPISSLNSYLHRMFEECPDEYFDSGPRSSSLKMDIDSNISEEKGHEVCLLAKEALKWGKYKTSHSNVEVFMLSFDKNTIGVEVPIWLHPEEFDGFEEFFEDKHPLTGHIDVIRVEEERIWVWDYKPNADKEKYASTQTYFYALMLSKRTNIPLDHFMCGYFDEQTAFKFDPSNVRLLVPVASFSSGY